MQSGEFTIGANVAAYDFLGDDWKSMIRLSDWLTRTRLGGFNGWNIYESRPDESTVENGWMLGTFYRAAYIRRAQSSGLRLAYAGVCTRVSLHFPSYSIEWSVCTAEWRSHFFCRSPLDLQFCPRDPALFRAPFSIESNHPPLPPAPRTQPSSLKYL